VDGFRLVRVLRTHSSEIYLVWRDDQRVGQIDIHYADNSVQADIYLESSLDGGERDALLHQLDSDVVSSYLPSFDRDQFIITIFVGREIDSFNYPAADDEITDA